MINQLLVVCIGNICRSPMCEALFAKLFKEKHLPVTVSSAGLGALVDFPADSIAQSLMQQRRIDLSNHRARQLSSDIVYSSEMILTMTKDQLTEIEIKYPSARGRVHRIGHWGGYDVVDPYKRPQVVFEQAVELIEQGVNDWFGRIWAINN